MANEIVKTLEKVPWLLVVGLILILNTLLNYTASSVNAVLPNALTGLLFMAVIGFSLYNGKEKVMKSSFNVFLMTGVFLLSALLFWFNAGQSMLTFSTWGLFILQLVLTGITLTHFKDIKMFGTGMVWFYASLMFVLFLSIAGIFVNYPQFGFSQAVMWNVALAFVSVAYLVKKPSGTVFGILALLGVVIALFAAFGFSGQSLSLFPI